MALGLAALPARQFLRRFKCELSFALPRIIRHRPPTYGVLDRIDLLEAVALLKALRLALLAAGAQYRHAADWLLGVLVETHRAAAGSADELRLLERVARRSTGQANGDAACSSPATASPRAPPTPS